MSNVTVQPFLMFQGKAEEAINFYIATIPGSKLDALEKWGAGGMGVPGTVQRATFSLAGQHVVAFDSPPVHAFTFTPSISLYVKCDTADEVDRIFAALSQGGQVMMPVSEYPFSKRYGWTSDRFGVSWQIGLK